MTTPLQILTKYWGHQHFRPMQEDIIQSILSGHDTLALLPTGGGKSICFQVPAMMKEGLCIVVSPLIALMKDQVENLNKKGIQAKAIFSGMNFREMEVAISNCIHGPVKFLYLSPERLKTESMQNSLAQMKISMIAIDEAHCISQWGYDFRPSYLEIAEIRKLLPGIPVLALTATATKEIRKDICEKLLFKNENVFVQSFERKNLSYVVFYEENKMQRLLTILSKVTGTGIVYTRNRRRTQEVAEFLKRNKISADYYHAGLDNAIRSRKQDDWKQSKTRIIVATNAFGMGIDKPDVRTVVHVDFPDSPEAYYQEAGRGGRDGKQAYAVILYNNADIVEMKERVEKSFPKAEEIKQVYQALSSQFQIPAGSGVGASFDFDLPNFCSTYSLKPTVVYACLKELVSEGYIEMSEGVMIPSRVYIPVSGDELYSFEIRNPKLEPLIKTMLRSYEGLFTSYTNVRESELASRCKITNEEVKLQLSVMDKQGILKYLPSKDAPQITYTRPRVNGKNMEVDKTGIALRKKKFLDRIHAMEEYATRKTKCRSTMLLEYFGEEVQHRCGVCDFCLERNKLEVSDLEFNNVKEQIKINLSAQPMHLDALIKSIQHIHADKAMKVLQWLIDNRKVVYVSDDTLEYRN